MRLCGVGGMVCRSWLEWDEMTIYVLVKIFTEKTHAEAFRQGQIYMRTVRQFQEYRDQAGELRGDLMEGLISWRQQKDKKPIHKISDEQLARNGFCMFAVHSASYTSITDENIEEFKNAINLTKECHGLGDYCVAVTNVKEFMHRFQSGLPNPWAAGLVEYFDEELFDGVFQPHKLGFYKRNMFSVQKEYRVLVDFDLCDPKERTIEIGNLQDITTEVMSPLSFAECLKIQAPNS